MPEGTKAVDVVALHADALYLIELKDFREAAAVEPFARALGERRRPVRVLAWILEDALTRSSKRWVVGASTRKTQLARRLEWLTPSVWVDDPLRPSIPLVGVDVLER